MNSTINCIIIEDERSAQEVLKILIDKIPFLEVSAIFSDAISALTYIQQHPVDLIFTDINLPLLSGIDFIKTITKNIKIIFVSAHPEFAIEGFNLDVVDFLVKPVSFDRLLKAASKAAQTNSFTYQPESQEIKVDTSKIFVKENGKILRVDFDNILYIEAFGDYVKIFLFIGKTIVTMITMKKLETLLPSTIFLRIHKSHIINLNAVISIEGNSVLLETGISLPIGLQFRNNVFEAIKSIN